MFKLLTGFFLEPLWLHSAFLFNGDTAYDAFYYLVIVCIFLTVLLDFCCIATGIVFIICMFIVAVVACDLTLVARLVSNHDVLLMMLRPHLRRQLRSWPDHETGRQP